MTRVLDWLETLVAPFATAAAVGLAVKGDAFGAMMFAFVAVRALQLDISSARR